jgi:hypothetical protein
MTRYDTISFNFNFDLDIISRATRTRCPKSWPRLVLLDKLTESELLFPSILSNRCLSNIHSLAFGVTYKPFTACTTPVTTLNPAVLAQNSLPFSALIVWKGACLKDVSRAGRSFRSRVRRPRERRVE